ncbi:uridine diphosphate-N-acetylglucosamine-binding protein YvcK [Jatrophihabitans sp.]|uniref:gluconeogenesis factor YvcK family protein n=1 Tax=Jatrophihabitans sp. TaxID=1932789 RepID=UPI0030C6E6C2|nr:putative gluconeosis factor [Jatrophihabitans sp.]
MSEAIKAVALGGGHGLHASLTALRLLTTDLTAVVTVADDGGSSGRIRHELDVLPPGDLRMALAALAGDDPEHQSWAALMQHRLGGEGVLAGHPVGNLVLTGLLESAPEPDPVAALARIGSLVGAVGRVLPMSPVPLNLIAEVDRFDPDDPARTRQIRGQSSIAATPGRVRSVRLLPAGAPACASAVDAVREADLVVLGPGSWFTSVIPHLLLRELGRALATTRATVVVTLNLVPQPGETEEYSPVDLLMLLAEHAKPVGGLHIDAVVADIDEVGDVKEIEGYTRGIGARLLLSKLVADESSERHDPVRLAEGYREVFGSISGG